MEAAGDKIRSNSQGWEDARAIGERQVLMVAIKGQLLPFGRNWVVELELTGNRYAARRCEDFPVSIPGRM